MHTDDTIAAIATPAGRGGIGVVRLSGPDALRIARQLLRPPATSNGLETPQPLDLKPWRVRLADLIDEQGTVMDRVVERTVADQSLSDMLDE